MWSGTRALWKQVTFENILVLWKEIFYLHRVRSWPATREAERRSAWGSILMVFEQTLVLSRLWSWWSGWDQAATGPGSRLTKIRGWDRKTGERGGRPVVHCHCFVPKPTHQPSSQHCPAQKCLDFDPWHFVSDPPILPIPVAEIYVFATIMLQWWFNLIIWNSAVEPIHVQVVVT